MRFRKKPVVIEAVKCSDVLDGTDVPEWLTSRLGRQVGIPQILRAHIDP